MIRAILITALLALGATAWAADGENAIEGIWETDTGGYVQIHKEGDAWVGTVVGSRSGEARYDTENPDEKLRGYLGISLLGRSQTWQRVDRDAPNLETDLLK